MQKVDKIGYLDENIYYNKRYKCFIYLKLMIQFYYKCDTT